MTRARALAALVLVMMFATPAAAQRVGQYYVIDGDTIARGKERIRIVGLDAPEIRDALCEDERIAGLRAKRILRNILQRSNPVIERRGVDMYRRTLAVVKVDGRDVADILIDGGYASEERRDWCPSGIGRAAPVTWSRRLRDFFGRR